MFLYTVNSRGKCNKGVITDANLECAAYNVKKAREQLQQTPFECEVCAGNLRHAIEQTIDEKVLNNVTPMRYRGGKKHRIFWDNFKGLNPDDALIDQLREYHGRLSGGGIHETYEHSVNPVSWEQLEEICTFLEGIHNIKRE